MKVEDIEKISTHKKSDAWNLDEENVENLQ